MAADDAPHLFCFGLGFTARALARRISQTGWRISGTSRSPDALAELAGEDIGAYLYDGIRPLEDAERRLDGVTAVLVSIPPGKTGDCVVRQHAAHLRAMPSLSWLGYLSTTGVYGDTGGALVDEDAPLHPSSARSERRVAAEQDWLSLAETHGLPVHVFRLAGIYGRGRSVLDQVRHGSARCIHKPGHVFSRIHVDDAAAVIGSSMARPNPGRIYNVCDDEPAEPADVVAYACGLLKTPPPPRVPLEQAAQTMSAMALSFWRDCRRVDNTLIKTELGVRLHYPDYRSGLAAILAEELDMAHRDHLKIP
ncbi:MAG: SDR family oxidoreductase [Hyphomicrobiales bacterium]|nr:SDR family oxidoreductase [Hyphomicrobiales bacterium]